MATHSSVLVWRIHMDREATIHRVAKSQTRLSTLHPPTHDASLFGGKTKH